MKSNLFVVALLLANSSGIKLHLEDKTALKWDDKVTAEAMNDFKLYNLDKQDNRASAKPAGSYADAAQDKGAQSLAEEMMDEATEGSFNTAT